MAYQKQNFQPGQVLYASQLNHMEDGIAAAEQTGGSASLTIGTVTSGATASASISGGKLNLVLPKGDKGDPGTDGKDGATGPAGAKGDTGDAGPGLTDTAKTLMLSLFEGAAYGNAEMQSTLDALKTEWESGGTTTVPVQSVTLSQTSLSLTVEGTATLTATVLPSNATNKTVTWSVSPSGYATVSGGKVTAVKAGSCTITATAGGKSATCAVTVTAASTTTEDVPGETPVYKLAQATEFTPSKAQCIDTGIKMLETIDPKPTYTILFECQYNDSLQALADTYVLLHCMEENSPWPGFTVAVIKSGELQMSIYGYRKVLAASSTLKSGKCRFAVQFYEETVKVWGSDGSFLTGGSPITSYTTAVNKSLLLGGYQTSAGVKGRYFDGTLYQCLVYDKTLTSGQIVNWIKGA